MYGGYKSEKMLSPGGAQENIACGYDAFFMKLCVLRERGRDFSPGKLFSPTHPIGRNTLALIPHPGPRPGAMILPPRWGLSCAGTGIIHVAQRITEQEKKIFRTTIFLTVIMVLQRPSFYSDIISVFGGVRHLLFFHRRDPEIIYIHISCYSHIEDHRFCFRQSQFRGKTDPFAGGIKFLALLLPVIVFSSAVKSH